MSNIILKKVKQKMAEAKEQEVPENKDLSLAELVQLNDQHADEIAELLTKVKQKAVHRFDQQLYKGEVKYQAWSKHFKGSIVVNEREIMLELNLVGSGQKFATLTFNRHGSAKLKKNSKGVLTPYTNEFNEERLQKHMEEIMLLTSMGVFGEHNTDNI